MFPGTDLKGKSRPQLRPARSTGWSWPRIVTLHQVVASEPAAPLPTPATESAFEDKQMQQNDANPANTDDVEPAAPAENEAVHKPPGEKHQESDRIETHEPGKEETSSSAEPHETKDLSPLLQSLPTIAEEARELFPGVQSAPASLNFCSSETADADQAESSRPENAPGSLLDRIVTAEERASSPISDASEPLIRAKISKRRRYMQKSRNAVVRRSLLRTVLGRQLARPVKAVLRRQARGEAVVVVIVQENDAVELFA